MTGFWIRVSLNKYSITWRATSRYVLYDKYSKPCLLLKIQTYSGIFTSYSDIFIYIVAYLEPHVTLSYSEPCYIQRTSIFRTQYIFRTLLRNIQTYSERCLTLILRTLSYSELCHIQNFGIYRTWVIFRILFI